MSVRDRRFREFDSALARARNEGLVDIVDDYRSRMNSPTR
jgi:hypothetical protein